MYVYLQNHVVRYTFDLESNILTNFYIRKYPVKYERDKPFYIEI